MVASVALLMPVVGGISWETFVTLRRMKGPVDEVLVSPMVPVSQARNVLVRRFLRTECTHAMFAASDMVYPEDALEKLLAVETDVAIGIYHKKTYPYRPLLFSGLWKTYIGYPKDKPTSYVAMDPTVDEATLGWEPPSTKIKDFLW